MLKKDNTINFTKLFFTTALVVHFIFMMTIWIFFHNGIRQESTKHFQEDVTRDSQIMIKRVDSYADILYGLRGFAAGTEINKKTWDLYTNSLSVSERYPGVTAIAYVSYTNSRSAENQLLAKLRKEYQQEGVAADRIAFYPESNEEDKIIYSYTYPVDTNLQILGFDAFTESNRREAIVAAVESGSPTITAPISIANLDDGDAGFALFLPVFEPYSELSTSENKWNNLHGLVVIVFKTRDLIQSLFVDDYGQEGIGLRITDVSSAQYAQIFNSSVADSISKNELTVKLDFGGRAWEMLFESDVWYEADTGRVAKVGLFLLFVFITGIVVLVFSYKVMDRHNIGMRKLLGYLR